MGPKQLEQLELLVQLVQLVQLLQLVLLEVQAIVMQEILAMLVMLAMLGALVDPDHNEEIQLLSIPIGKLTLDKSKDEVKALTVLFNESGLTILVESSTGENFVKMFDLRSCRFTAWSD